MTSAKETIGVIGLGSIGRRHATNLWKELGQTEVIGYDIDLKDSVGWVCADLDFLINMATAFVVCSPTDKHWEHLTRLASTGKPIFMEKPVADDNYMGLSDAMTNVKMVGYNLRFHPCVQQAKDWISNDIGNPLWANFTLGQRSIKPPYLRDGVILNWSHEIDLCLYLLGGGKLSGSTTRLSSGRDDLTDIIFKHDSGCQSLIHLDYLTQPEVRQSIIVGKKATVILDLVSHNAWLRDKDGQVLDHMTFKEGWDQTYISEMAAFLRMIDGKADDLDKVGCTGAEALEVLKVCLEVRKDAGL